MDLTFMLLFKKKNTVIRYACITLNARSYSLIIKSRIIIFIKTLYYIRKNSERAFPLVLHKNMISIKQ